MVLFKCILFLLLFYLPLSIVVGQSTGFYTAYQISFQYVTTCPSDQYFDIALLKCSICPTDTVQKAGDITQCDCKNNTYYYAVNQGGGSLICDACPSGYIRTTDGFGCTINNLTCSASTNDRVPYESDLEGNAYPNSALSSDQRRLTETQCISCSNGTWANPDGQRCSPCASVTPHTSIPPTTITCCSMNNPNIKDGICLTYVKNSINTTILPVTQNRFSSPTTSSFFEQHLEAAFYLCLMNINSAPAQSNNRTLLSNATACQILANIATMQLFYPGSNYAYNLYQNYIWAPTSSQVWSSSTYRMAVPFLAYPSTFYQEISSASYDWIPSSVATDNLIQIKLAKYSSTGAYLGLVDAFDAYIQLCGGGYSHGRPAFTYGTQYSRTCNVRIDALWNSSLYDTVFFDPYILFNKSNTVQMLPTPVVIKNYVTTLGTSPNKNDDESNWVYHRRFFLIDRVSGVTSTNDLKSIHYAKSVKFLFTLSNNNAYFQPPVIVAEYAEISSADFGKESVVQISFQSTYRMNLDGHIRDIWTAIGVLCGLGALLAFIKTLVWYSRDGKQTVDLGTIGKFLLYNVNIIGTVFFIVMAGVSLWWLIFFKRTGSNFLVLPSSTQQTTFTALVIVAFVLKTIDIIHLIIYQSSIDIFFMDWEKPKTGDEASVSIWRSLFIANEFNEIQTFRRVSVTFLLLFVLLFLKVVNLENIATAQPGIILFPTLADYTPGYNGILRIGIAFSMWLAGALILHLIYMIFYQRFIEDKIINFVDLCSVSNVSIFILKDRHYGFYIHGRSSLENSDVNVRDMLMNLERESSGTAPKRGLQEGSDDQIFIIRVDRLFRSQFDRLLRSYEHRVLARLSKKDEERTSNILLKSYLNLNTFLCGFISRSTTDFVYKVRPRRLFEKIFNLQFSDRRTTTDSSAISESTFYIDPERNFTTIFFSGCENSLFIWNMATFLFIDYFAFNYILAAFITYILNMIVESIRSSLGQRNLSKKTLIPKNFLI